MTPARMGRMSALERHRIEAIVLEHRGMNWRRGLFRLWVVSSAAWIAVVVVSLNGNIRSVGAPIALHDRDQRIEFPNDTPRAVMKKALVDYLKARDMPPTPPPGFTLVPEPER